MKKISLLLLLLCASTLSIFAQAKKYALVEHFTNSRCGSCAFSNPGFYAVLGTAINKNVHHISYHPSTPYSSCVLYQENTSENQARFTALSATGTPQFIVNGMGNPKSVGNLTAADITSYAGKTSPLEFRVQESATSVRVRMKAQGTIPTGNYRLFVALVERQLDFASPNGEKVHYDVFRKMVSNIDGDVVTLPTVGNEIEKNYNFTLKPNWKAAQMYVVAWVIDNSTKEVINSGSKFTTSVGTQELLEDNSIVVSPNPANSWLQIDLSKTTLKAQSYVVTNYLGQVILTGKIENEIIQIDTDGLIPNQYLIKINTKEGAVVRSFLKQ